jgi:hypothetical protein
MANAEEARIEMYFHCKTCSNPKAGTNEQYLAIGWTPEGIQVVCENCGKNVVDLDFIGQKIEYYSPGRPYIQ